MAVKHDTEVVINGKVFTLSGYESEEYLQRVAAYINSKISEYNKIESFSRQSIDVQNTLLQLNIADDYFKIKEKYLSLKEASEAKDKELYDAKHDLITNQIKMKSLEETLQKLRIENNENQKKIVKLETELGFTEEVEEYYDDVEEVSEGIPDVVKEVPRSAGQTAASSRRRSGKRKH
ncbi:MAG: cell division protein ZapA [Lachnospiraceae bacterium]|nr:cell division protein ZapA [Lachnospiraceae bacterium]